jgi:transcriptional regulator with XRE-family HTH domain
MVKPPLHPVSFPPFGVGAIVRGMSSRRPSKPAKPPGRHFIAAWREFRGMTQSELAEGIGYTTASLSRVENFKQAYNQPMLEAIGQVLHVSPADLLIHDPTAADPLGPILAEATASERLQIAALAETVLGFRGKGDA